VSADERRKGEAALAASARAFRKAQNHGLVWLSEDGRYLTHESFDMPEYKAPANPDQLPLTH
jgi:hypothetical protein